AGDRNVELGELRRGRINVAPGGCQEGRNADEGRAACAAAEDPLGDIGELRVMHASAGIVSVAPPQPFELRLVPRPPRLRIRLWPISAGNPMRRQAGGSNAAAAASSISLRPDSYHAGNTAHNVVKALKLRNKHASR